MKKLFLILIIAAKFCNAQTETIYQSDTLQYTADKAVERKPCKIVLKYNADVLTAVTIKYNDKKLADWSFTILGKMNYYWNCEEYHAKSNGMDCMIGTCGEGKKLDRLSFLICTDEGAMNNDCMKYINLKKVEE